MPDWHQFVAQHLAGLALDADEKGDVLSELAGHLEEVYDSLRRQGLSEQDALRNTLEQVSDWKNLQRKIYSAKKEHHMTPRAARFWLPSLATLVASMLLIPLLESLKINPQFVFLREFRAEHRTYVFTVYTVWLLLLPFVGALGAHLSKRAGGTRRAVILSGVFPALAFSAALLVVIPFAGILEHGLSGDARSFFHSWTAEPFGALGVIAGWVLAPGAFLLLGVLAYSSLTRSLLKPAS